MSEANQYSGGSNYSYNHNNSNSGALRTYQQGSLVSNPSQQTNGGKIQRGSTSNLGQVNDRSGLQHRTRYTNRKQQSRSGNAMVMPESAKSTPRAGGGVPGSMVGGGVVATPPPHHSAGGQVLPQYQYNFPNMVKVTSPGVKVVGSQHPSQQMAALGGTAPGLSIVSAPATLTSRPELSSAGSQGTRGAPSVLDNVKQTKLAPASRIRGIPPKLKDMVMRTNHAVVYS